MKKPIFYLLLAVGALGGACQKFAEPDEPRPAAGSSNAQLLSIPPTDNGGTINQTRAWFEARRDSATVLDVSVAYTKPLNWNWAKVEQGSSNNLLITVPEEDYFTRPTYAPQMSPHGCRSLIFIRNAQGGYRTQIMEMRPDEDYIQRQIDIQGGDPLNLRPLIHPSDYTGYVLYYDGVDGKLTFAVRYEDGVAVHTLQIPS